MTLKIIFFTVLMSEKIHIIESSMRSEEGFEFCMVVIISKIDNRITYTLEVVNYCTLNLFAMLTTISFSTGDRKCFNLNCISKRSSLQRLFPTFN